MPNKTPITQRHIRRQAKKRADDVFNNIIGQATSSSGQFTESVETEIASSLLSNDSEIQNYNGLNDVDYSVGNNYIDISQQSEHIIVNTSENYTDSVDICSKEPTSCDQSMYVSDLEIQANANIIIDEEASTSEGEFENRFSDSEAESIPDFDDDEICIDIDSIASLSEDQLFIKDIKDWSIDYKITHNAFRALLAILNKHTKVHFPKDPRTMLKTPKTTDVRQMGEGQYCHIGLNETVKKIVMGRLAQNREFDTLKLLINIDGAPLVGNSSEKGLWTILCKEADLDDVFLVGVYLGAKKPDDPNEFVEAFVIEAVQLINDGFTHDGKLYKIRLYAFVFDSPAKAYILCVKYPNGYFSCTKCLIEGTAYGKTVYFPLQDMETIKRYCHDLLRDDEAFKRFEYGDDYQREKSILTNLPHVGLVSCVPLDGLHVECLGVMRLLIRFWIGDKGRNNKNYKLSAAQIQLLNSRLERCKYHLPDDFNRRCRSLEYWTRWKATEYRHFLLYLGPVILKGILKPDVYDNFMKFHVAMFILSNPILIKNEDNVKYAENLTIDFIYTFQLLYGRENVTSVVHATLHMAEDVLKYGTIESFSAFPFESYLCSIKKLIRKGEKPLQQIARRLSEYDSVKIVHNRYNVNDKKIKVVKVHYNGIIPDAIQNFQNQYKIISINSMNIKVYDDRNNCLMLKDGTVVIALNILMKNNVFYIVGKKCQILRNVFSLSGLNSSSI